MAMIDDFFAELDRSWIPAPATEKIRLPVIGAMALLLQTDYERGTKDSDVLETKEIVPDVRRQLLSLAGKGSRLHLRHKIFLEIVSPGIPLLPQQPRWFPITGLNSRLVHFQIDALSMVDVIVSKLRRFHANDRHDIQAMVELGLVQHDDFIARFRSAIELFAYDARAPDDLGRCIANFHQIERDAFGLEETLFELPDWLDR
jgi:hypothetical protein